MNLSFPKVTAIISVLLIAIATAFLFYSVQPLETYLIYCLLLIVVILGIIIVQRTRKEKELNGYKARLIESTREAVYSVSPSFIIRSWNKGAEKLYGYTAAEAIGQPTFSIVRSKMQESQRLAIRKSILDNGAWEGELEHMNKQGQTIHILASATASRNEQGEIEGYVSVALDISERKNLEKELKRAHDEMEAFTYSVSHDLRAPLRAIIGYSNILEEDHSPQLDEEAKRLTGTIKKNTLRMGQLIDDLLAFSKAEKIEIHKVKVDTSAMVAAVVAESAGNERVKWNIAALPFVNADSATLRQVWINLISNAIKYSNKKEQAVIEIDSYSEGDATVFFIKDNGAGFDEKYKHKLFKVFQRLHRGDEFEGTGIGLSLVEKIISRHGGRVWAEGQPGEGACFYFSLPQ